jgi:hypothetical protein
MNTTSNNREDKMKNFQGYELQRLVGKLRILGMYQDADRLEKDHAPNYLSDEAREIVRREAR